MLKYASYIWLILKQSDPVAPTTVDPKWTLQMTFTKAY